MRKLWIILLLCIVLSGCAAVPTFETLGDVLHEQTLTPVQGQIRLSLPEGAIKLGEQVADVYVCDDYYLETQTLQSGDLNRTIQAMSGFTADNLTVMTASTGDYTRYEWVWSAASEEGEKICRAAVIDDGSYHYCLTAVAPADTGGELSEDWNDLFSSFEIA